MDKHKKLLLKRTFSHLRKIMNFNETYGSNNTQNSLSCPSYVFILFATPYPDPVCKSVETFPQGIVLSGKPEQVERSKAWAKTVFPLGMIMETKLEYIEKRHPLQLIINKT